jgi:hypothetical protein
LKTQVRDILGQGKCLFEKTFCSPTHYNVAGAGLSGPVEASSRISAFDLERALV